LAVFSDTFAMKLSIEETGQKGRGVFATGPFAEGELIESCPVLVIPVQQRSSLDSTVLYDYYFPWGADSDEAALCLGFGSLYNHSFRPNARYLKDANHHKIHFVAIRAISTGEEVTVNYNGDPESLEPLWFDPVPEC
jgi:uncharacterized protein